MTVLAAIILLVTAFAAPQALDEPREWIIAGLVVALVIGFDVADAIRHVQYPRIRRPLVMRKPKAPDGHADGTD